MLARWMLWGVMVVGLVLVIVLGSGTAVALELKDPTKPIPDYTRVEKQKDGTEKVVFDTGPQTWSATRCHRILTAYGAGLDKGKIPSGYARVVKENDEEKVVFSEQPLFLSAGALHQIFTAYGLTIADPKKLPAAYARVVKENDSEKVVLHQAAVTWSAKELNDILAAYK